jgi:C4-type Zn-finger protein
VDKRAIFTTPLDYENGFNGCMFRSWEVYATKEQKPASQVERSRIPTATAKDVDGMKTDRHFETKPARPPVVGCPNCKGYPMAVQGLALRTSNPSATDRALYFCDLCGYTKIEAVLPDED